MPNLTTVEVNTSQMAELAVKSFLSKIKATSNPIGMIQVKVDPVLKDSVS